MSGTEPRQYRVHDVIGRGGFGTVYRAELRLPGGFAKDVALKVLNPAAEGNPQHLARLRDEARLLGLVRHRALIGVDGLVKLFDRWTVVMEYVDGVSLLELLDAIGRVPITVALQVVEEVASGLHAAYTASDRDGNPLRLLHRDVKPSNVQLTRHGEVKLLDFGVARAEFEGREATSGSLVYGSLPYLAPERLDLEDGHTADVFSLVVTLVQLVTGSKPTAPTADPARHAERVDELCRAVEEAGGTAELVAIVRRGLAWEPAARPEARELERLCRTVRATLPDVHLGDWAAVQVDAVQSARQLERGEFTGMLAAEAQTTERHRHLAELLGVAIPTTFDDPVTTGAEETAEVPPPEPTAPGAGAAPTVAVPPPEPPRSTRARPTRRSSPPRRSRWLMVLLLVLGVVAAVGLAALTLGSSAVVGVTALILSASTETSCLTNVRTTRESLAEDHVAGLEEVEELFDASVRGCRDGSLGFWTSSVLMSRFKRLAADGELSDLDRHELRVRLRELGGP